MKKTIQAAAIAAILMAATPAFASPGSSAEMEALCTSTDMTKLNAAQIENVKALCAKPEPGSEVAVAGVTPDKVRAWGSLGAEFSTAIVETAKGLGVAANDLLFTPVGFMIAFYFMWDMVGGILIGIPLLIALWIAYFRIGYFLSTENIIYEHVPVLWGAFTVKKVQSRQLSDGETPGIWYTVGGIASLILSAVIIGILIF